MDNLKIAELLAQEADRQSGPLQKAYRRASRLAFRWPLEAETLYQENQSLTVLPGIGPFLAKRIQHWMNNPPEESETPLIRKDFLTLTEARRILLDANSFKLFGDLHMHSIWSDGSSDIRGMAQSAIDLRYKFIAITDHSHGLKIARGIDEKTLFEQGREIQIINQELLDQGIHFRILRSVEVNLSSTGECDLPLDCLNGLDLVVGSFHSALRKKEDQTDRYIVALSNPGIQILGHPRGRIYNFRLGLDADWNRIFEAAAEFNKALEIDCYPDRQDLNVELLKLARERKVLISIGTDAHHPEQLQFMEYGIAAAIRAGLSRERIVNCMSYEQLMGWIDNVRMAAK